MNLTFATCINLSAYYCEQAVNEGLAYDVKRVYLFNLAPARSVESNSG
jgi:hypothetical protein